MRHVVGVQTGMRAVAHISGQQIRDYKFSRPPLGEQRKIVEILDELKMSETQRLESIYRQKLAALDALKKSLLHQAFNAQL